MPQEAVDITTLPDNSHYAPKHIPIEKLTELRSKGLSFSQIAAIAGCSKTNVILRLQANDIDVDNVEVFKNNEATLLSQLRYRLISSITDDEIKKAPLATKMMAFGIAYDKYRLETGQSTAITDSQAVSVHINQLSSELDKIRKRRMQLQGVKPNDNNEL